MEEQVKLHQPRNVTSVLSVDKSKNLAGAEICLKEFVSHLPTNRVAPFVCFNVSYPHHKTFIE